MYFRTRARATLERRCKQALVLLAFLLAGHDTALAALTVTPASLSLRAQPGAPPPSAQLTVSSQSPAFGVRFQVSASADDNGTWLSVGSTVGATPSTIKVTANPDGLAPGTFTGAVIITEAESRTSIPVTLVVPDVRLSVSPPSWTVTYESGATTLPRQTFSVTSADTEGNRVPVDITTTVETQIGGQNLVRIGTLSSRTPTQLTVTLSTLALPQGSYETAILLTAKGISNSPLRIPINLNVIPPRLLTSQAEFSFNYQLGASIPAPRSFFVSSSGSLLRFNITATAASGEEWLTVDKSSGSTSTGSLVAVSVDPENLKPGLHQGTIRIESPDAANTLDIPVTLTVRDHPAVFARPASVSFVSYVFHSGNSQAPAQQLTLSGGTTGFTASAVTTSGGSWLTVKPAAGTTPEGISLSVNAANLAPGDYSGFVHIDAPGAANSPLEVPVTLTVSGPLHPLISTSSIHLKTTAGTSRPVSAQFSLTGRFSYTLSATGGSWLSATSGAGGVGSINTRTADIVPTTETITVFADPSGLAPGTYSGTVVVSVLEDSSQHSVPVEFVVGSAPLAMPQIIDGGGGKTTLLLVNGDVDQAPYTLRFWQDDGQPYALPVTGEGIVAQSSDAVPPGGLAVMETEGRAGTGSQGWAQLESAAAMGGTVVFRRAGPGVPESEAAVPIASPLGKRFYLAFDNTAGFITAAALVNPSPTEPAKIDVTLRGEDGQTLSTDQLLLDPRGHVAFAMPTAFPATAGRRGLAEFSSSLELAALGLRFNPQGAFTSFEPVAHQSPGSGAVTTRTMPQIVSGANSQTTIVLMNPGDQPVPFSLEFHSPDGDPLPLPIAGLGTLAEYADVIPVGGARVIETEAIGNLLQGWAEVVSSQPIGGTLIFRLGDSEASAPVVPPLSQSFMLPFDNTQGFVAGIAALNPDPMAERTVLLRLRDQSGQLIQTEYLTLPPASRQAFVLTDRFPELQDLRGTIEVPHAGISVLELRFNPRGAFTSISPVLK